ncbi:hypothetical protein INE89_01565 [Bacteroides thetaiotaomicron]|nr:hypothetical protein INE89_01565 [Bacteroides thetaiotaomicron]
MPTTYGNDIVYCLKSHCGVRGYCRQKWVLQVQIICKFSNERTCKRNKDVQGLSCGFEGDMKIKDKITQSLASITVELQEISPDFYVIGASAMILSGIEVGETADIDILTTEMNSCKLQHLLKTYMEISPETKEDDLFRSNFARFKLPLMDIEVMGDLQIKKNDIWQSVCVKEYKEIFIGNLIIKIPTIEEQKRILSLFGREKDLKRILILNHYLL